MVQEVFPSGRDGERCSGRRRRSQDAAGDGGWGHDPIAVTRNNIFAKRRRDRDRVPKPGCAVGIKYCVPDSNGSAPDIAGKGLANPIATIASFGMALRYSFDMGQEADAIDRSIANVLDKGLRTGDIMQPGMTKAGTAEMGKAILAELKKLVA